MHDLFVLAMEYHYLLLYFILPVVRQFLPPDYFLHFSLLVEAITTLLLNPSKKEVRFAGLLLSYFVKEMEQLYGIAYDIYSSVAMSFTLVLI